MQFHCFPFLGIEFAWFEQYRVRGGNFADVMHGRSLFENDGLLLVHPGFDRNHIADFGHTAHMVAGFMRARFDYIAEPQNQFTLGIGDFLIEQNIIEGNGDTRGKNFQQFGVDF